MRKLWLSLLLVSFFSFAQEDAARKITFWLIEANADAFLQDGPANLTAQIPKISAEQLIQEYRNNPLQYDEIYDGKLVRIAEAISAIKATTNHQIYLTVDGKDKFEFISLYVDRKDENILSLRKGDIVDKICKVTNYNDIRPRLVDCQDTITYIQEVVEINKAYIDNIAGRPINADHLIGVYYQALYVLSKTDSQFTHILSLKSPDDFYRSFDYRKLLSRIYNQINILYSSQKTQNMNWYILPELK